MADALNRHSMQLRRSVDPSELPGDPADWIVNPDLSAVAELPGKYWTIEADRVVSMTETEQATVDATELAQARQRQVHTLQSEAFTLANEKYSRETLEAAQALYIRAVRQGDATTADQLEVLIDLVAQLVVRVGQAKNLVLAATTLEAVEAVSVDLSGLVLPEIDLSTLVPAT